MGRNALWMNRHENTFEQIFAEFDEDEDDTENDIYSNNQSFRKDTVQKNTIKDFDHLGQSTTFNKNTVEIEEEKSNLNSSFNNKVNNENGGDTQRSLVTNSISSNMPGNTPRINQLNGKTDNKKRLVDTMGQVNPMTKTHLPKPAKDVTKSKLFQKSMATVKDLVKSELYKDLNNMIDHAVSEHASMINVTQIQKIPENKTDSIKEEIAELKIIVSKLASKEEAIEKKVGEFDRNFPRLNMDLGNLRTDMQTKASKDELQSINMQIPSFATKQDIELFIERMKNKTDSQETNDLRISLESLKENQKSYCLTTVFQEKNHEYEDVFKKIYQNKVDKTWALDKFSDVYKLQDTKENDLDE